LIKLLA